MKRIVYTQVDGVLAVIIPSPNWSGTIEELARKDVPNGLDYSIVDTSKIPTDRTFRAAWEKGTNSKPVKINMDKARNIHMGRIRKARDKEMAQLDIEQLKGNDVAVQKKTLRDLPDTLDLTVASTPDELKALWPNELKKEN